MLGKLLKYEFKSTSRIMWILYAAVIVCGALLGLLIGVEINHGNAESTGLFSFNVNDGNRFLATVLLIILMIYMLLIFAMMILTTIMIILRFYRNLLQGEGYLMHTLPVTPAALIGSKLIVAVIWMLISFFAAILSAFMITLTSGLFFTALREIPIEDIIKSVFDTLGNGGILMIFAIFFGIISQVLQFYFAMALGNLANQNKMLFSVVAYIGISTILSIVQSIIFVTASDLIASSQTFFTGYAFRMLLTSVITGVIFFFGTHFILKNHLNLA